MVKSLPLSTPTTEGTSEVTRIRYAVPVPSPGGKVQTILCAPLAFDTIVPMTVGDKNCPAELLSSAEKVHPPAVKLAADAYVKGTVTDPDVVDETQNGEPLITPVEILSPTEAKLETVISSMDKLQEFAPKPLT